MLPIFALANAGVVIAAEALIGGHGMLMAAIIGGLVVGKPVGFLLASWFAVKIGLAEKPVAYSWPSTGWCGRPRRYRVHHVLVYRRPGVSHLSEDFAAAKIAVFAASVLSAIIGVGLLIAAARRTNAVSTSP